eukprot:TRINITY_DN1158_c0_g1_i1.p1 TRINITY_DN1158_c0_g1~~TRINITY_DN1158_c0_g1_i1.p1  ORF type:complete len:563 (+),score=93.96 TRINITY_DN1158_c0_g1_i1:111-1799(+)
MGGGTSKRSQEETEKKLSAELARMVAETHFELLTPAYITKKMEEALQLKLTKEQQTMIRDHVEKVLSTHFRSKYRINEILGKGGYSVVHSCQRVSDGQQNAVKVIDKQKLSKNALKSLKEEIVTMQTLSHPRLIQLFEVFDHGPTLYLVIEKVEGGELFDEIVRLHKYDEEIAAEILHNFLDGLGYMHSQGYVHRDIKPENILLLRKPRHPKDICKDLKIVDFGFAAHVGDAEPLNTCCGTPRYIAPEVLNAGLFQKIKGYGKTCDMWAVGVITFILLFGKAPFYHRDRNQLWNHICGGIWSIPAGCENQVSDQAIDFINKLIEVDTTKRMTCKQALEHPFMTTKRESESAVHLKNTVANLEEFNAREKFKAAIFGIQSLSRVAYIQKCLSLGVKTNTGLIKSMDNGELGDDTTYLDMTTNYVGGKGLCAVLEMINEGCPNLRKINLRGCSVNNTVITALVDVALTHPKLETIDLSSNPLSYKAGTLILSLVKQNHQIKQIDLEDTKIQEGILRQINTQLELNKKGKMKDYFAPRGEKTEGGSDQKGTVSEAPPVAADLGVP